MSQASELNRATLEQLHRRLEKPLFNVVYRWVWNREDARDLVQEAFVRVWRHREQVDLARVEPLLYRTALNLAANQLRARKLWRWTGLETLMGSAAKGRNAQEQLEARQEQLAVRRAVEALPEKLRQVLLLFEFSRMGHREIAETLQIPMGTVASRRNAALKALSQSLGKTLTEEETNEPAP